MRREDLERALVHPVELRVHFVERRVRLRPETRHHLPKAAPLPPTAAITIAATATALFAVAACTITSSASGSTGGGGGIILAAS